MQNTLTDTRALKQRLHRLIDKTEDENELLRLYIALTEPDLVLKKPVVKHVTSEQSRQLQESLRKSP